jgi:membrane protein DedA with SNARE-associated domain
MGLGSVSLGVAATSVTLHAWAGTTAHATSVVYAARPLHQVVQTIQSGGSQVGAAAIVLVAFIWVAIAVINIAYARRQADRA